MLTSCLKDFELNNIIKRIQYAEIPPKVEYSLTEDGIKLISLLRELDNWGKHQLHKLNTSK